MAGIDCSLHGVSGLGIRANSSQGAYWLTLRIETSVQRDACVDTCAHAVTCFVRSVAEQKGVLRRLARGVEEALEALEFPDDEEQNG